MSDEIVARLRGSVCYASTKKEWPNVLLQEAADLIERLQAEKSKMEKDAARYRWLRSLNGTDQGFDDDSGFSVWDDLLERHCIDERFDAEVDAAMEKP